MAGVFVLLTTKDRSSELLTYVKDVVQPEETNRWKSINTHTHTHENRKRSKKAHWKWIYVFRKMLANDSSNWECILRRKGNQCKATIKLSPTDEFIEPVNENTCSFPNGS